MANQLKTPQITLDSKLLSFDLESNGLHGQAFAVGAVVFDGHGRTHEEFSARVDLGKEVDPWVKANVLPVIADMQITHPDYISMREGFWEWYVKNQPDVDYVLVNNGYPVEYRFLLDCQEADMDTRYWQHPFPILELSSLQMLVQNKSKVTKSKLFKQLSTTEKRFVHHPVHDAKKAAIAAFTAFEQAGLL